MVRVGQFDNVLSLKFLFFNSLIELNELTVVSSVCVTLLKIYYNFDNPDQTKKLKTANSITR
jgi:hypothetical protein